MFGLDTDGYDPTIEDVEWLLKHKRKRSITLQETLTRYQAHIYEGHLDPKMPAFLLIGQDILAPNVVRHWAENAELRGTPKQQCDNARLVAHQMDF